ncbi:increased DNA methylation 1-like [Primulina huaijiensis]|uniref:increased DNA methylation 1-like n=1 Tax=Primulina huaijiensis TaxID=1492673 RepID=UPI003CC71214
MPSKSQSRSKTQKLTRKDLGMHKVVLADNVLEDGTNLSYIVQGEVSPSQFEAHAGFASRRKPYDNIFTSDGVSLHEISLGLSTLRKSSSKGNDDLCSICKEGGKLLCCDNCPRAFHPECVPLSSIPQGKWYCKYCENMFQKAKVAKLNANAIAAGRVAGVDPLEEIKQRCIRIVGILEADVGGCALCRLCSGSSLDHDFSAAEFNDSTVIICDQCEKEYHVGCLRENKIDDLKELPEKEWFCCTECLTTNSTLQKLISDGEQMLPQPVLDIVKKKYEEKGFGNASNLDIKWRLLSGKTASEDTRAWLSGAVNIFHDRFDPIADSSTGPRDLIPDLVYGRQFKGQDLGGMYCAILIVNSEVVSAATFRGYFPSLFFCVETLLKSLNVKDLVLPAADEAESLWKERFGFKKLGERFGFKKLGEEQLDQYTKNYQLLIFQGTSVLHKSISQPS